MDKLITRTGPKACYEDARVEWIVEYHKPYYGTKTVLFDNEKYAREYFTEKQEAKRKKLKLIRRTTTIEDIEEQ